MLAMIDLLLLRIPFKSKFVLQTKSHDDTGGRYGQYVDLIEIYKFSGCARFIPVCTGNTGTTNIDYFVHLINLLVRLAI